MSTRTLTCIGCPMGCRLSVEMEQGAVTAVSGNTCPRGEAYARKECVAPERVLTGTVRLQGGRMAVVPVRSAAGIPKDRLMDAARALNRVVLDSPAPAGTVAARDIAGTGVDMVTTKNAE